MDDDQLLKLMTASIAAPMIQSATNAEMNPIELGGDGKLSDQSLDQILELANWYAKKVLESP